MRANYEGLVVPLGVYALWLALVLDVQPHYLMVTEAAARRLNCMAISAREICARCVFLAHVRHPAFHARTAVTMTNSQYHSLAIPGLVSAFMIFSCFTVFLRFG